MDEFIDSIADTKILTTLEAHYGYWEVPIKSTENPNTTFVLHVGTYQYNRMRLSLKDAPETFQRGLDLLLSRKSGILIRYTYYDVIIYSK